MPNTINKVRVHQALIQTVKAGAFYAMTYDPQTDEALDIDEAVAAPIAPSSVKANELQADVELSQRQRQRFTLERARWTWLVRTKFSCEVTAWRFEEALMLDPPCLPVDSSQRQVQMILQRIEYTHPPTNQAHSGSEIDFYFNVRPLRR